jgi:hypothetical protein
MSEQTYRVRIAIYDGVNTLPDQPTIMADEPYYGEDELLMIAARIGRGFRRYIESDQ